MTPYRVYRLTSGGHITEPPQVIVTHSDAAAIALASDLIGNSYTVEVWNEARKVAYLVAEEMRRHYPGIGATGGEQGIVR